MLTFGRPRATLNKDVEQAVEQGRTRTSNKRSNKRSNKGRTRVEKRVLVEEKSITNKVVEQGSNKDVEQGVEQGRTSDGRTRCRTRLNKDVEQGRTRSNKDFF